jgi:hypothetical protein
MQLTAANLLNLFPTAGGEASISLDPNSGRATIRNELVMPGSYTDYFKIQNFADSSTRSEVRLIVGDDAQNEEGDRLSIGAINYPTGLWHPRLTVKATGNVGIGITEPTSLLHVAGDLNVTGQIINAGLGVSGSGAASRLRVGGSTNPSAAWGGTTVIGADGQNKVIAGYVGSSTNGAVVGAHNSALNAWADLNVAGSNLIFRTGETERMRMNSSGNLGLGTGSPTEKLEVIGNSRISGRAAIMAGISPVGYLQVGLNGGASITQNTFAVTGIDTRPTNRGNGGVTGIYSWPIQQLLPIGPVGDVVAFQGRFQVASGYATNGKGLDVLSPDVNGTSTVTNAIGVHVANQRVAGVANSYGFYQASAADNNYFAGNTGIGTTSPAAKLDVNGTVQISGDVKVKNQAVIRVSPAGDIDMGLFVAGIDPSL